MKPTPVYQITPENPHLTSSMIRSTQEVEKKLRLQYKNGYASAEDMVGYVALVVRVAKYPSPFFDSKTYWGDMLMPDKEFVGEVLSFSAHNKDHSGYFILTATLSSTLGKLTTTILVDNGASENFMDQRLANYLKLSYVLGDMVIGKASQGIPTLKVWC